MFTGIVEGIGRVVRLDPHAGAIALDVEVPSELTQGVRIGDSVALDGCCLTVTACSVSALSFEAVPETLRMTALGDRKAGDGLNVERALPAGGRLDGHIVQGHVDGVGTVASLERMGSDVRMRIASCPEVATLLVHKGSVAVDGVSLTVIEPDDDGFSVALIPHTLSVTTLGDRVVDSRVNLEADILGKYVRSYLERLPPRR